MLKKSKLQLRTETIRRLDLAHVTGGGITDALTRGATGGGATTAATTGCVSLYNGGCWYSVTGEGTCYPPPR